MKKWLYLVFLLVVILCSCMLPAALGEGSAAATIAFDATPIVTAGIVLIGTALGAVLLWLTYKYLVPLLKVPIVGTLANWAVDLAEKELGSGNGEAKFDMAAKFVVDMLGKIHLKVDTAQVRAAIVSAWTALNFDQISAGVKSSNIV